MNFNDKLWIDKWSTRLSFEAIQKTHDLSGFGSPEEPKSSLWCASLSETCGALFKENMTVFDYGCGCGRYANFLSKVLKDFTYYGLEPQQSPNIKRAKRDLGHDPRLYFGHLGTELEKQAIEASDVVIIGSVFTHLPLDKFKIIMSTLSFKPIVFSCYIGEKYTKRRLKHGNVPKETKWSPEYHKMVFYTLKDIQRHIGWAQLRQHFPDKNSHHKIFFTRPYSFL